MMGADLDRTERLVVVVRKLAGIRQRGLDSAVREMILICIQ